jgi:hypothetical protein
LCVLIRISECVVLRGSARMGGTKTSDAKAILRPRDKISVIPSLIKNKAKRLEVVSRLKQIKKKERKLRRQKNAADAAKFDAELPAGTTPKNNTTRTIETMREEDETMVQPHDQEVQMSQQIDEFAPFFSSEVIPKVCITTCRKPTSRMFDFIRELLMVFPNSVYFERRNFDIKKVVNEGIEEGYTNILVFNEDQKEIRIHHLLICFCSNLMRRLYDADSPSQWTYRHV